MINGSCRLGWQWIVIGNLLQVVHENWVKHLYHFGIDFVFLHFISWCLISHSNTIVYIYHFHLFLIHCWIQIQVSRDSCRHSYNSKITLAMIFFYVHHTLFSLYTIVEKVCARLVFCIY
jgi:hypothetical protein